MSNLDVLEKLEPPWIRSVLKYRLPIDASSCYCSADDGDRESGSPITVFCVTPQVLIAYSIRSERKERNYLTDYIEEVALPISVVESIASSWQGFTELIGSHESNIQRGTATIRLSQALGTHGKEITLPYGKYDYMDKDRAREALLGFVNGLYASIPQADAH